MLYRYSEVFRTLLAVADLGWIGAAWLGAYLLRFYAGIPAPLGIPEAICLLYTSDAADE